MSESDYRLLLQNDFRAFLHFLFQEAYPEQSFIDAWYLDVMADTLMRASPGSGARLMLNLPPRSLKSFTISIVWPLFLMARMPDLKVIVVTGTQELATELGEIRKRVLALPRLLSVFPGLRCRQTAGGLLFASGSKLLQAYVGRSGLIGRGADLIIVDDPLTPAHAREPGRREEVNAWYQADLAPRLNSSGGVIVVAMQRLHLDDLCGWLMKGPEPWRQVVLPAVALKNEAWLLSNGVTRRRHKGEPLCAARADLPALRQTLYRVGAMTFAAQYLQQPMNLPVASTHRIETRVAHYVPLPGFEDQKPPPCGFFRIPLECDIDHACFGGPPVLDTTGFRIATDTELEGMMVVAQARLIADMQAHSSDAQN